MCVDEKKSVRLNACVSDDISKFVQEKRRDKREPRREAPDPVWGKGDDGCQLYGPCGGYLFRYCRMSMRRRIYILQEIEKSN